MPPEACVRPWTNVPLLQAPANHKLHYYFCLWFRGSGPKREATVPMLPRVLGLVSQSSQYTLIALSNSYSAVQLISRCVVLTALHIIQIGLVYK